MNRANAMKQSGKIMPSEMATELLFFLPDGAGVGGKGDGGEGVGGAGVGGAGVGAMHPTLQVEAVGYFPFALKTSLQLYVLFGLSNWQLKLVLGTGVGGGGVGIALHHVPIPDVQDFSKTAKTSRQDKQYKHGLPWASNL
jgi:hypothetical protein